MRNNIEVILIDDGSPIPYNYDYSWLKTIRLDENSGGASVPRNAGLDIAQGKYITFIDIDDMISDNYIETIINKINSEDFDYCYFNWQSKKYTIIITDEPPEWNCCVWNCIYKKEIIDDNRFDPKLKIGEDYKFNQEVRKGKRANIKEILYYYNSTENSLIKQGQYMNEKYTKEET